MNTNHINNQDFKALIEKYLDGKITLEEVKKLVNYYESFQINNEWVEALGPENTIKNKMLINILEAIQEDNVAPPRKVIPLYKKPFFRYAVAACFVLLIALPFVFQKEKVEVVNTVSPGTEKAILVLANGKQVELDNHQNETITEEGDLSITNANNTLVYSADSISATQAFVYNTLKIPVGGIYSLELSDGTKVWLNSKSSLKYPVKFGKQNREVQLEGEAYFEVAKNALKPFIVNTNYGDVTVLGTHFNISAYNDDPYFTTTLQEGAVKVTMAEQFSNKASFVYLNPGEQAAYNEAKSGVLAVKNVDAKIYSAWKGGEFYFDNASLENILLRMSRWYNFEVSFANEALKQKLFKGVVLKNKPLDYLLDIISQTANINYEITLKGDVYEVKIY
ncbi:FecR family protein [Thalassobellus sediminis]|uniref:FecR family protein n=1 Tax=Thalassobellus sediminis TaxID=3367753 RepID=UPI0037AC9750